MKGLSTFLTYTFTILLGFTLITFFSFLIYSYYNQVLNLNIQASLKQLAVQTTIGIIKLYDLSKKTDVIPENSSSIVISEMDLDYPNKVSGKNFEVELISSPGIWVLIINMTIDGNTGIINKETTSGAKIIVKTTQRPLVSYEYDIPNIPVVLQGKFKPGDSDVLKLIRYNYNGSIVDNIVLGDSDIIIGITNMV